MSTPNLAESDRQTELRRLRTLYGLMAALTGARAPDEVYGVAISSLLAATTAERAAVLLFDEDGVMRFKAWRNLSPEYRAATTGYTPWKQGERGVNAVALGDVHDSPDVAAFRDIFDREGIRSLAFIPLEIDQGVFGACLLCRPDAYVFPPEELGLAQAIANHLSLATERKRMERASRHLAAIVESSDDAIVSKDLNGIITSWNIGAERIFGYTAAEAIGQPITLIAAPDSLNEMPGLLEQLRSGIRIDHYETRRRRKDGRIINVSLTISPVRDSSGTVVGASKIARDITDRKLAEQVLLETNDALRRANDSLAEFAYIAAHDLQEPLRTVVAFSEIVQRDYQGRLDEAANQHLQFIVDAARRMSELITDVLSYSRVSSESNPTQDRADLNEVAAGVITGMNASITETGARIDIGRLPVIRGDAAQFGQVFQNLLSNAIKYRKPDVAPEIKITAEKNSGEWRISVSDNGQGFRQEYASHVFRIFKRLHGRDVPGSGIGLAICKAVIERHDGQISAESEPGKGTTFTFSIPLRREAV